MVIFLSERRPDEMTERYKCFPTCSDHRGFLFNTPLCLLIPYGQHQLLLLWL